MSIQKRTKTQIDQDRRRIAELTLMGYPVRKIADIISYESGRSLGKSQVSSDLAQIRKEWRKEMVTDYDYLMNKELTRLDVLENELWEAWRKSQDGNERTVIEEVARLLADSDQPEMVVNKVTRTLESNQMDTSILNQILSVQKERRKLLGLYAPSKVGINLYSEQVVRVKGYSPVASPDLWPSLTDGVEEGEFEE